MTQLDTSFLVDLLRGDEPALALLEKLRDEELAVSVHVVCELFAGVQLSRSSRREGQRVQRLLTGLRVVYPEEGFAAVYGKLLAKLLARGARVSTMDLLIATAAVAAGARLVTRNQKDFSRIPGLAVVGY